MTNIVICNKKEKLFDWTLQIARLVITVDTSSGKPFYEVVKNELGVNYGTQNVLLIYEDIKKVLLKEEQDPLPVTILS